MKKLWLAPLIVAAGVGILVLILSNSETPSTNKDEQADTFPNINEGEYVTTADGLKYRDVKVGDGPEAKTRDHVLVHYTGWLTNGRKFDSSHDRKQPYPLTIGGRVIRGWNEGIPGMKAGGRRILVIPPELAYGEDGQSPDIPPNARLVFAIELLEIKG
jgi:FKBP-type peptidyl-prolyl cis-trans isomerase